MRQGGIPIKTGRKDFASRRFLFTNLSQPLSESWTNSVHAKGTTIVHTEKYMYWNIPCVSVLNDGEVFVQSELDKALDKFGCESANTSGNQNGSGMKNTSSYFIDDNDASVSIVVSKGKGDQYSYGLIDANGDRFSDLNLFSDEDKNYIKFLKEKFLSKVAEGTVFSAFNASHFDEFDVDKFERIIIEQYSTILQKIKFTLLDATGSNVMKTVKYQDLFYHHIDPQCLNDEIRVMKNNQTFEFGNKIYMCDIEFFNLDMFDKSYPNEARTQYDIDHAENRDFASETMWGVVAGYSDGYTPLHNGWLYLIGSMGDAHESHIRVKVTAKPIDNDSNYADLEDWQKLYTKWGMMNACKVQAKEKFKFGKEWGSFQKNVVKPIKERINKWRKGDNKSVNLLDEFSEDMKLKTPIRFGNGCYLVKFVEQPQDNRFVNYNVDSEMVRWITFNISHPYWKSLNSRSGFIAMNQFKMTIVAAWETYALAKGVNLSDKDLGEQMDKFIVNYFEKINQTFK